MSSILRRASGYLALGLPGEAEAILDEIFRFPDGQEYVELRIQVEIVRADWRRAETLATQAIEVFPNCVFPYIHRAYVLHEMNRTEEAYTCLNDIRDRFPHSGTLHYNLACYSAQTNRLEEARKYLWKAMRIVPEFHNDAKNDPDLVSFREELILGEEFTLEE